MIKSDRLVKVIGFFILFTFFYTSYAGMVGATPEIKVQLGHSGPINSVAFSPDGKSAFSGSGLFNNTLKLWDLASGKEIKAFEEQSGFVWSVALSPDGKYALSGSSTLENLKLWDLESGKEIRTFSSHCGDVFSVAFSPDGKSILSGFGDNTLKLWDLESGKELRDFSGHSGPVSSVAFSPDGKYTLSGSSDTTIRLWKIKTGELICTATATPDGKEHLIWTPEHFFAGTERAMKNLVYIVDGVKIISIDRLYNIFHRPDLVAAKLQGKDISAEAKQIDLVKLIQGK